jgi:hypothetical protein
MVPQDDAYRLDQGILVTTVLAGRMIQMVGHLAAVLQEGRKYRNIHARSGVIGGIPA